MNISSQYNHEIEREKDKPSNVRYKLIEIFREFELEEGLEGAIKLRQIIDSLCFVLGQTVTIFITNRNGKILYSNDHLRFSTKLREVGIIENDVINIEQKVLGRNLNVEDLISEETMHQISDELMYIHSHISPVRRDDEVSHFIIAFHDVTQLRRAESQLNIMYSIDPLTQLPNRHCFEEDLLKKLQLEKKSQNPFALFFLDLDRFKFFNDTLGHQVGDELIMDIANKLRDIENKYITLYRFGGDEFIFLIKKVDTEEQIDELAEKILQIFKSAFIIQGNSLMLTCSIGISIYPDSSTSLKKLVECADTAMHYAKERGKDTYQIFSENMNTAYSERLKMEAQLRIALEKNQFFLHYQPQIDMKTNKIIGVEALVRWNNPELGIVAPNEFIPLAEEIGLIDPIGDWVLKTACQQVKNWQKELGLYIRVGINISPKQFQRPDFVSKVERVLQETGLAPNYVDLEITENGLMQNSADCLQTLYRLKSHGVKISIDDFGTGYSSLSYLKRFPIDTLKIDQSFVRDLIEDTNDQAIVTSIISLAHNMKLNVIAEGVETVEIVNFLNRHKCDEMQGYLYSKPLNPHDFESFLKKMKQ
ncbi:hypothetical protein BKP45_12615 [Anaerobacillus alkalidiazotrophicus]|uniref:Diguanylate cyclase n=1 Tax=Anaerobacillus alkalidiazotrophicus TaxID=472963 RepID=A0A1S2M574_9BACI|nr:EAL domain-containing protein [Anaerobacillus alkalidiazotrophicus]OIJ18410.1 hypothetical protein BKP45_18330 [Anaerobacillus alkalidiazotrophicus]OIJ19889.1 hypothetical protein BKP45_12615 [Anaerobacillus alkalidiazotrophicus]